MTILDPFWTPFGPLFRPLLDPIWTPSDLSQEVLGGLIRGYMEVYVPIYMPPGKGPLRGPVHMASPCAYRSSYPSIPSIPPKRGSGGVPKGSKLPHFGVLRTSKKA